MTKQATNRRQAVAVVGVMAVLGTGMATTSAQAAPAKPHHHGTTSLAQVLAADGDHFDRNWNDFDILDRAVNTVLAAKPKSAVAVLADGKTKVTAFLPTDRAFRRLVNQVTGKRPANERQTFNRLVKATDVDTIESVLLYHVVPGATITYHQAKKANGAELTTALGSTITVRKTNAGKIRLRDFDTNDRNARVIPMLKNLNKGNRQIAHGIDRVMRPIALP